MAQLRVSEPKKQGDEAAHVEECPCWALEHTSDEENIQVGREAEELGAWRGGPGPSGVRRASACVGTPSQEHGAHAG